MEPSVEQKFNDDLWYVLQKIRKHVLYGTTKKDTKYPIIQGFFGTPYNDDEEAMMEKLHEWSVITLEEQNGVFSFIEDELRVFIIKSINPKFSLLYRLFENALKENIDAKRIFDLRQEIIHPIGQDKDLSFDVWRLTKKSENPDKKKTLKILTAVNLSNIQYIYGLSQENRSKTKRLIELIQNNIELAGFNRLTGIIKIPEKLLDREGYSLSEAELLIEAINRVAERSFIEVKNIRGISSVLSSRVSLPGEYGLYDGRSGSKKEEYLIISLFNPTTLKDIKDHIESFEEKLAESISNTRKPTSVENIPTIVNEELPKIKYNSQTGVGQVNNKKFKFKDHQPEYRVFKLLYERMNKKVLRYEILLATHFYEDGEDQNPARKISETNDINEVTKKIREKTGLNTEQLVNNNGNLTLVGFKIENPTNPPQN